MIEHRVLDFFKNNRFKLILLLLIPLSILTFILGLDSLYIFKNGDERVYMHIGHATAESHQWLPLQSKLHNMTNTKPPLLFWQAITSTNWIKNWSYFNLRLPNVIYTLLTALLLFFAVKQFSKQTLTGILAALIWLSFMGTYRYGRPFLTEPPIIFWLSLPFFSLLFFGKRAFESKVHFPIFAAICIGFALLYKSFFYIVPTGITLFLWYCSWRDWNLLLAIKRDAFKVVIIAIVSLAIFALWFALDPTPETIWREFVLRENLGKMHPHPQDTYLYVLLWGQRSIWFFIVTSLTFAGFFFFVLLSTFWSCWHKRKTIQFEEKLLWLSILVFFLIFCLPSHRSGRYMLPIMPALATFIALYWQSLPLWGFRVGLFLQLTVLLVFSWVSWNLQNSIWLTNSWHYSFWHWLVLLIALTVVVIGLLYKQSTKVMALTGSFLCYCALTSSLMPLDGPLGHYSDETIKQIQNRDIWIPCNFRAKNEEYRLLLPGAHLHGYNTKEAEELYSLSDHYPLYITFLPQGATPTLCNGCKIIGARVHMLTRRASELKELLSAKIVSYLFVNEYLISSPAYSVHLVSSNDLFLRDVCQ